MKEEILLKKFVAFVSTSGIGWGISMSTVWILCYNGWNPYGANLCADFFAVTYVFITSVRNIFVSSRVFLFRKFLLWLLYQFFLICIISLVIGQMGTLLVESNLIADIKNAALISKIFITPITIFLNFMFACLIIEKKRLTI